MEEVVAEFPNIFPQSPDRKNDKGEKDPDKGAEDGNGYGSDRSEATAETTTGNGVRVWFQMIDEVIKYTNLNIIQVFSMPVRDFFTYYTYCAWKIQKKNDAIKKMEREMKRKSRLK